jgi:hypothetical protein
VSSPGGGGVSYRDSPGGGGVPEEEEPMEGGKEEEDKEGREEVGTLVGGTGGGPEGRGGHPSEVSNDVVFIIIGFKVIQRFKKENTTRMNFSTRILIKIQGHPSQLGDYICSLILNYLSE